MTTKKYTVLLCSLLFSTSLVSAQGFNLSVQPAVQLVRIGESAVYTIHIQPTGGFSATVFLSAQTDLPCTFSKAQVNFPYEDVLLSVKPNLQDTGTKVISIRGVNNKVSDNLVCTLHVSRNVQWSRVASPEGNRIGSLRPDRNGNPMFLSEQPLHESTLIMLHRFQAAKWTTDTIPVHVSNNSGHGLGANGTEDATGTVWLAIKSGLLKYDGQFLSYYTKSNSDLGMTTVFNTWRGRDGSIVIVGFDDDRQKQIHLARRTNNQWLHFRPTIPQDVLYNNEVFWYDRVCFDSLDNIWLATQSGGAVRVAPDGTQTNFNSLNSGLKNNTVYRIECDANNRVSFLHSYGSQIPIHCSRLSGTTWDFIASPYFNNDMSPNSMLIDDDLSTWSSSNYGLHHIIGTSQYINYNRDNSPLSSNNVLLQMKDKNGNFWMMTSYENYYTVFNPNGLIGIPLLQSTDLPAESVVAESMRVIPNPASDVVLIQTHDAEGSTMKIYSLDGRICAQSICNDIGVYQFQTSALVDGVYRGVSYRSHAQVMVIH